MIDKQKKGEEKGCCISNWGMSKQQLEDVIEVKKDGVLDKLLYIFLYIFLIFTLII